MPELPDIVAYIDALTPRVIGCSGAIWLDVDGDGRPTSAHQIATQLLAVAEGDLAGLISSLQGYDQSITCHAAHLLHASGTSVFSDALQELLRGASESTKHGFRAYAESRRRTDTAAR